jgi:hypothetical protein
MPASRICTAPGCPAIVTGGKAGYCPKHTRSNVERGYGAEHRARRRAIAAQINAGQVVRCVTCGVRVGAGFHLGHNDDRTGWLGPQCAPCNLRSAGQKSQTNRYS